MQTAGGGGRGGDGEVCVYIGTKNPLQDFGAEMGVGAHSEFYGI